MAFCCEVVQAWLQEELARLKQRRTELRKAVEFAERSVVARREACEAIQKNQQEGRLARKRKARLLKAWFVVRIAGSENELTRQAARQLSRDDLNLLMEAKEKQEEGVEGRFCLPQNKEESACQAEAGSKATRGLEHRRVARQQVCLAAWLVGLQAAWTGLWLRPSRQTVAQAEKILRSGRKLLLFLLPGREENVCSCSALATWRFDSSAMGVDLSGEYD